MAPPGGEHVETMREQSFHVTLGEVYRIVLKLEERYDSLVTALAAAEKERNQERSRRTFALTMAVISPVVAAVVAVLVQGAA